MTGQEMHLNVDNTRLRSEFYKPSSYRRQGRNFVQLYNSKIAILSKIYDGNVPGTKTIKVSPVTHEGIKALNTNTFLFIYYEEQQFVLQSSQFKINYLHKNMLQL